jgi:hypothetical protein
MPTPTNISELSTVAGSNYPAGTDSPIVLDDVQRAHASFIAQLRDSSAVTQAKLGQSPSINDYGTNTSPGVTDMTAAVQACFLANAGGEIEIYGTVLITSTCVIPDGTVLRFKGRNASIKYTGSGNALEIRNSKNIALYDLNVDLSAAGASAVGLAVRGCWWLQMYKPKLQGGNASQALIQIETSYTGGDNWGSYLIEIHNPQLSGTAGYGINCFRTSGDGAYDVTHLNIYGGWAKSCNYGIYARNVTGGQWRGFVADNGIDGINIANCNDILLEPGELGPNSGYGINFGNGNTAITLIAPNKAASGGTSGYMNTSNYTPQIFDQGKVQLFGSRADQSYYATFESAFSYAQSFLIRHKGSSAETIIMEAGEGAGTTIRGTVSSGGKITLAGKTLLCPLRFGSTYGATVAIDASTGMQFDISPTNGTAFTISNPTSPIGDGQTITMTIRNISGGAMGAITWGALYKMAAWTNPANGFSRSITFKWNATNWVEITRTPADVPN